MNERFEPQVGDTIETKPLKVSKKGKILGSNPTNWGAKVRIKWKNIDVVLSDEEKDAIADDKYPFSIKSVDSAHPAEIIKKNTRDGLLYVEFLPESAFDDDKDESYEIKSNRESQLHWDGTPQNLDSRTAKKRKGILEDDEVRGSKNDLLGGHL